MKKLYTPWGEQLDRTCPLPEYPRPQLRRESYYNLNGIWEYTWQDQQGETLGEGEILVPFSPESLLSGCDFQLLPGQTLRYRRSFTLPEGFRRDRVLLHFGAVDQSCRVWVNHQEAGGHEGGYLPFTLDITELLREGENLLEAAVQDAVDGGVHSYGKQRLRRGGIWYTAQSGIWQTVWMESVPDNYITALELTPDLDGGRLCWRVHAPQAQGAVVTVWKEGQPVAKTQADEAGRGSTPIPRELLRTWSPEDPFLYDLTVELPGGDRVESYFGMRKFSVMEYRGRKVLALNNQPYFHHGVLDQGYWSDGLYTPPSDEAMIWDIQTMKDMGFNVLRKHIKIEPMRWYYHCDRLGVIVWQDMVSGGDNFRPLYTQVLPFAGFHVRDKASGRFGRGNPATCQQFLADAHETVRHLYNCVSLGLWVPFNEGWGQFDALELCRRVRQLDGTRPIDHASGWHDQGGGDLKSRHVYYHRAKLKYDGRRVLALTEFGGYSLPVPGHISTDRKFGYRVYQDRERWMDAVEHLYEREVLPMVAQEGLAAAIYTQLSDVEDEINGLVTYDRRVVKAAPERMAAIARSLRQEGR